MKMIKLNNGITIPLIGIGTNTFGKVHNQYQGDINYDTKELVSAIKVGYRLLDTAISYRNEAVIGRAVSESLIAREDFIITTKLPGTKGYILKDEISKAINQSLENLKTDYIDIFLMHHPWDNQDEMLKVYLELEKYVEKGVIKTLGVSNFTTKDLELIINNASIKPAINQIASYPGNFQNELIAFGNKHGIVTQAWSPLNKISDNNKAILSKIGEDYNKTWAQVILNFQVSRGVIVIPKSHRFSGQKENFEIFDFNLLKEHKAIIENLN